MTKATAIAHPIQGLIKYHGLRDWKLRLPFHDSISVCMQELHTLTTVATTSGEEDISIINNEQVIDERSGRRMMTVVDWVRKIAQNDKRVKIMSKNYIGSKVHSYDVAKGLGFSASAGAALVAAAVAAFDQKELLRDHRLLSIGARRLSGSAARSVAGGFAKWYASDEDNGSLALQLASRQDFPDFRMIIYPLAERIGKKTEQAHKEAVSSPFFEARIAYVKSAIREMEDAIQTRNIEKIGLLAERDSLNLHAVTMTGENNIFLLEPESIKILKEIREMRRKKNLKAFVSFDTGPTTYINTHEKYVDDIISGLSKCASRIEPIVSTVGDEVKLSNQHLF
jgi:phosphomevalonate decarboxylase